MEKQLESCRKKALELIRKLEDIFGKEVMVKFWVCVEGLFRTCSKGLLYMDEKTFREYCSDISKLLASISIRDAKVSRYRDILKEDFDACVSVPTFTASESRSNMLIACNKMVDDLEKFVKVCKGFIVEGDVKAQLFHNELIAACNEFTRQTAEDNNMNLQVDLHLFCDKLVRIIKFRKKSSVISKLTSKSSSYLKDIIKNADKLDDNINNPEAKYFDGLAKSIENAIEAGKKMKQRRKEHYPILSYPDVQEAFAKVIKIIIDAKKKMLDKKD